MFEQPPTLGLLRHLARDQLDNRLERAVRMEMLLQRFYGSDDLHDRGEGFGYRRRFSGLRPPRKTAETTYPR